MLLRSIPFLFSLLCVFGASAQAPFPVKDSIDANNINALALVHGDMWWNPGTGVAHCKYPPNSIKNIGFAAALWLSGYDNSGQLHVAAQTYRQDGNDYWPGPLDGGGELNYATSEKWAKIWKVRRNEIFTHQATTFHNTANTPESILTWPGKGNSYAKGKDGVALAVTEAMAPFVDLNGDGIYQPLNGEYPDVPGEQALWWVFSDNGPTHAQTHGRPLKAEVHAMAYAFKRNTLIDNVVYYDYTVVNRSANDYHDMRMALWDDVDLGYYLDDFIGFDSARRMAITYNGSNDDGISGGHPANSYGLNPPVRGVTLVYQPGDDGAYITPAGSFMVYNNDPSIIGIPNNDTFCNYLMRSHNGDGTHLKNNLPVIGWPLCRRSEVDRTYALPDDPTVDSGWNECTCGHNPGDRRFVLATNDFSLHAGASARVVMALVLDTSGHGCPMLPDFDGIRQMADTAWFFWHGQHVGVANTEHRTMGGMVFPVPAHGKLYIQPNSMGEDDAHITIRNILGQVMVERTYRSAERYEADVSAYPPGVYSVTCQIGSSSWHTTFLKE